MSHDPRRKRWGIIGALLRGAGLAVASIAVAVFLATAVGAALLCLLLWVVRHPRRSLTCSFALLRALLRALWIGLVYAGSRVVGIQCEFGELVDGRYRPGGWPRISPTAGPPSVAALDLAKSLQSQARELQTAIEAKLGVLVGVAGLAAPYLVLATRPSSVPLLVSGVAAALAVWAALVAAYVLAVREWMTPLVDEALWTAESAESTTALAHDLIKSADYNGRCNALLVDMYRASARLLALAIVAGVLSHLL